MNFSILLHGIGRRPRRLARPSCPRNAWPALVAGALGALAFTGSARADLLVLQPGGAGKGPGVVHRYNEATGARLAHIGQVNEGMRGLCLGANGELLIGANTLGQGDVYRFGREGQFLGSVASGSGCDFIAMTAAANGTLYGVVLDAEPTPASYRIVRAEAGASPTTWVAAGTGGLTAPRALAVGADGHLYVADGVRGILRYDGVTGAFIDVFVSVGAGGLQDPTRLLFGPDKRLYVASGQNHEVLRFDGASGQFIDTFVPAESGGLRQPAGLAFARDGSLFVSSRETHQVLRYHGATGAFLNVFASGQDLHAPTWLVFTDSAGLAAHTSDENRLAGTSRR